MTPHGFDSWADSHRPALAALLKELRQKIITPPRFPAEGLVAMAPLRSVLEEARTGIPVNEYGYAQRGYGERRNRELGFESQDLPEAPVDVYLELDALLMIGFALDALDGPDDRALLTSFGEELLADPVALWKGAHRALHAITPCGPGGELWFLMLPWLLSEAPFARMSSLLAEIPEPEGPEPDGGVIFLLYTYLRALGMFAPRRADFEGSAPPLLSESGKAGVIESLRMLASEYHRVTMPTSLN